MPETPEQRERRRAIWRHNSFLGHAAMLISNMEKIICSTTATDEAKQLADKIQQDGRKLRRLLATRKDQQQ
jgi:hypothetical protein